MNIKATKFSFRLAVVLVALFALRLAYGLCSEFWFPDELQVYLIGLKFYATGHIPCFGADVVYTETQIPGALQGLLVGLPFYLFKIPEAPFILLNILSFAVLCFFALYLQKKFPGVPTWFTWIWLMTCPWTMNFSTHVLNPSYVLFGSVLFFIAFFEVIPRISIGFVKPRLAFFLMGFALFWVLQLHMSWVLLIPFICYAFWVSFRRDRMVVIYFFAGCLIVAITLIPTLLAWGLSAFSAGAGNTVFNGSNIKEIGTVLLRFVSFATFEIPRFIDTDGSSKWLFFKDYWPAAPFILLVILAGFLQVAYLIVAFFLKNPQADFAFAKWITLGAMLITWGSFFFSVKGPSSHTFYVLFPLVMIYSFYCWQPLFRRQWFAVIMAVLLISGLITHGTLAYHNYSLKSMYLNRDLPLKAIQEKDYHILGERRAFDKNP
ncbi:MAG TPA: hypothetical protein PLB59_07575 [Bacteroidales bacterium]|jgi:hypothetical protein|nr:hypothetical protein [Bacteroidales bacterium]HNZ43821.1 hypothetical protein [Bacteroidales bacterium]HPB25580.1 hypothetical protein [Bacteroidales bacterium]HPI29878.1 hypothetical protein [Bacteroidales bacterium]HQN15841.1 hypothetical protein [Bacteroidales bacterium]